MSLLNRAMNSMLSTLLAVCLITGNHYSWTGSDSRWNEPNNWGAMDYPGAYDDITVGQTWGTGWTPETTIDLMGVRTVNSVDVWDNYETTFINGTLTTQRITGTGSLIIQCNLTTQHIELNTLTIGQSGSVIPEPNAFELILSLFLIITSVVLSKKYRS